MYKEQKIASFQQGKNKLQLLKLTNNKETQMYKRYLANSVGGYKLHLESGEIIPIRDEEVKIIAERYNPKKDNENYYYYNTKEDCIKTSEDIKYQVRFNRKRVKTTINKDMAIKYFNARIYGLLFQTKLEL